MKSQAVIKETVKQPGWFAQGLTLVLHWWPFLLILAGGFGWYGKTQVAQQAATDSITKVLTESRYTKIIINDYLDYKETSNTRFNMLEGTTRVIDKSYVRTLESLLKGKDEVIQYQKELLQAKDEALKKKRVTDSVVREMNKIKHSFTKEKIK